MKKIVLRNVPPEILRSIKRKALNEDLTREEAAIAILREAEIQREIEHDLRIMESHFEEGRDPSLNAEGR